MVKHIYDKGTSHEKIEHYDLVILGGGPAGLTAAIYAGRYHLNVAVIAKSFGGTANLAGEVENWPGYYGSGMELMNNFREQAEKFGAKFLSSEVDNVERDSNGFVFHINNKEVHSKSLIVALGSEHRKLNVPGEKEFLGKGVSYCATCDGMFFKNKTVAVIGGADSAAKAALYLSDLAKQVYIIYRREQMRCEPISLKKIENKANIKIYYNSEPKEIIGDKKVNKMIIEQSIPDKNTEKINLNVDGVFVEAGATPVVDIIHNLKLNLEKDYIVTDKDMKTSVKGVFAAGDNTNNKFKQIVVAAGEGAVAAKSAYDYLRFEYE